MATIEYPDVEIQHALKAHATAIDFAARPVIVKVGTPTITFHVNERLLRDNSGFFRAALQKEWLEGQTRKVELPDYEPEHFNIWLNWLYGRRIVLGVNEDETVHDHGSTLDYVKSYQLGDVLLDPDFKDAVCDAMAVTMLIEQEDVTYTVPNPTHRRILYATTSSDSRLRQLVVDRINQLENATELLSETDDPAFLLDFAKAQAKTREDELGQWVTAAAVRDCTYHEHGAGVCYRKKYANIDTHIV